MYDHYVKLTYTNWDQCITIMSNWHISALWTQLYSHTVKTFTASQNIICAKTRQIMKADIPLVDRLTTASHLRRLVRQLLHPRRYFLVWLDQQWHKILHNRLVLVIEEWCRQTSTPSITVVLFVTVTNPNPNPNPNPVIQDPSQSACSCH